MFYLKNFVRDPAVASVAPTSRRTVRRVCDWMHLEQAQLVVEYGPGNGVFTRQLLQALPEDATLVALERNPTFYSYLNREIRDPRLKLYHAGAENALGFLGQDSLVEADYVLAGIPFSFQDDGFSRRIVEQTSQLLKEGGSLVVYQTFPRHSKSNLKLVSLLEEYFECIEVFDELLNVPPLTVFCAEGNRKSTVESLSGQA